MRKRNWGLIIATLILIIIILFLVVNLSNKNKKLGFISDDSRQIEFVQQAYRQVLDESLHEKIILDKDKSLYINFITYNHYLLSQENTLNSLFAEYSTEEAKEHYTLSNEFDLNKLTFTITLKKNDDIDAYIYTYKLDVDKKENKIKYKLLSARRIGG